VTIESASQGSKLANAVADLIQTLGGVERITADNEGATTSWAPAPTA
jgi:hypothetical protein